MKNELKLLRGPCQIKVGPNKKLQEIVQLALFEMGFDWRTSYYAGRKPDSVRHFKNLEYLEMNCPIIGGTLGALSYSGRRRDDHYLFTIEEILRMAYEEELNIIQPKRDTITIGDSTFYKDDFEAATKYLERV